MDTDSTHAGRRLPFARLAILLSLAGCAAHGPASQPARLAAPPASDASILHLLNRATFGPRPGDVDAVRRVGIPEYVEAQLHPERIDDSALENRLLSMSSLAAPPRVIAEEYIKPAEQERKRRRASQAAAANSMATAAAPLAGPTQTMAPAPPTPPVKPAIEPEPDAFKRERQVLNDLSSQKVLRAVGSERQLQEVLVDFWFNHFNVFAGKGADRLYVGEYERDVIRPRVFGRFRDLLGAVAESPAMLFYLDNWMSIDPEGIHPAQPARRTTASRAARPVSPARPRNGLNENYARELMELHTLGVDGGYTQRDVTEVARCFTGWTIAAPNDGGGFVFDPRRHDEGQKVVLGHVIAAGGGKRDGDQVLDILASSPSTARFVAGKLVRKFVSDDPPSSLVDRAAARFRATGGDLREVVRTILLSREFASTGARRAKAKTPFEFATSALRASGARVDDPMVVANAVRGLGMPLYSCQPPTGYADRADAWVTAGALLARMNFAVSLASNRMRGVVVDLKALAPADQSMTPAAALARSLLGPDVSDSTRAVLARQSSLVDVAALALGSPDFQQR